MDDWKFYFPKNSESKNVSLSLSSVGNKNTINEFLIDKKY